MYGVHEILTEGGQTGGERVFHVRGGGSDDDDGLLQRVHGGGRDRRDGRPAAPQFAPMRLVGGDILRTTDVRGVRLVQHGEKLPGRQRPADDNGRSGFGHGETDGATTIPVARGVCGVRAYICGPDGTTRVDGSGVACAVGVSRPRVETEI